MSTPTASAGTAHADDHGGHAPGEHHPHVLPLSTYFGVYFTLLILTAITVAVSYVDLGNANLLIALAVATAKALCVALIFMHLLFDRKFNAIVFSSSLIFLAIFIGFTMADTSYRGFDGRSSADGPTDVANPFGGTRSQAALERLYKPPGPQLPKDMTLDPKMDIGLHDATPTPSGDAVTVDVPSPQDAPGAVEGPPAPKEKEE